MTELMMVQGLINNSNDSRKLEPNFRIAIHPYAQDQISIMRTFSEDGQGSWIWHRMAIVMALDRPNTIKSSFDFRLGEHLLTTSLSIVSAC